MPQDEYYCPEGTIYDPSNKTCNFQLLDIASQQQSIVNKRAGRANGSSAVGIRSNSGSAVRMGKESFDSNPLTPPWVEMPDGGFPISSNGTISTPAIGAGFTDVIGPAGQNVMQVPNGYDGVIKKLVNFYNGGGFVSGSGALVWRLLIDGQAARNYDSMLVQFGVAPFPGEVAGIRVYSNQTVQLQVKNVSLGGGGTQIFGFLGGWYYPSKLS